MEQLVPSAHALTISEKEVDKALQLAEQASDPRLPRRQGLQMIHQAESDLNEIIEAPATSEGHR